MRDKYHRYDTQRTPGFPPMNVDKMTTYSSPRLTLALLCAIALSLSASCGSDEKKDTAPDSSCEAGALGCPCGPGATCGSSSEGKPLACTPDNLCELNLCSPGSLGCQCGTDGGCDADNTCREGLCAPSSAVLVSVGSSDVRACDLVFKTDGRSVAKVQFTDGTLGSEFARGNTLALSFIRRMDAPFGSVAPAVVQLSGSEAAGASALTVDSAKCYDSAGDEVSNPGVQVK